MTREAFDALVAQLEAQKLPGAPLITMKTIPQGAATSVWAGLVAPAEAIGGRYAEDCHVALPADPAVPFTTGVLPHAADPETAKALWTLSERLVGESF